jgi:general secretion pathway protein G
MRARSGFTLVEILIVVIILGILAAIVIPQFTNATTQARDSSLKSDLQTVRSQIELYKVQHSDALPGAGSATFAQAMTGKTDIYGATSTDPNAYGPYLQQIPANPYSSTSIANTVRLDGAAAGANTAGWRFSTTGTTAGEFQADDSTDHAAW